MGNFVHLHLHSEYSLLDGSSRCESIVAKAKELGMDAVALTDHGVMYGVVEFYLAAKKAGIKPIIGCEVYVAQRTRFDKTPKVDDSPFHLLLLAKNEAGYKNLLKLVTFANLEGFYYKPRVDKELLKKHSEGLIALTSCLAGEVPRLLMEGQKDKAAKAAKEYQEIFGAGNFYLEIQDHNISEQKKINPLMAELVKELDIPVVATNDTHYLERRDSVAHDVLLCIQTGKTLDDPNRMKFETDEFYFKSEEEMNSLFSWIPEAVSNSSKIAAECNLSLDLEKTHLPHFITPNGEPLEAFLEKLCREGMEKIFPAPK
ncbi:MAG: PHP domain-containing protein, partial [Firmicutes bacterium]|nr:PHP domain-containing protein [Bacillota bacterium]